MRHIELTEAHLRQRYVVDLATVDEIASECGCSVSNVRKRIKDWRCLRGRVLRTTGKLPPWNKGLSKETDERLKAISDAHKGDGNPMSGQPAWNRGLSDPAQLAALAESRKRLSDPDVREKMAAAKRGKFGELSNRWTGGTSKIGPYREHRRTVDGRRVYEHRWVAEQALGWRLSSLEHVHHIDRNEAHNARSNLLVLSEADHAILHGAIYRGECDTRVEQIAWLRAAGITFWELPDEGEVRHAA